MAVQRRGQQQGSPPTSSSSSAPTLSPTPTKDIKGGKVSNALRRMLLKTRNICTMNVPLQFFQFVAILVCVAMTCLWVGKTWNHHNKQPLRSIDRPIPSFHRQTPVVIQPQKHPPPPLPADFFVRGKRDVYTPCPPEFQKKVYIDLIEDQNLHRAYRWNGWEATTNITIYEKGLVHILYKKMGLKGKPSPFQWGKPWHRYSKLPGFAQLESKDLFLAGFRKYQAKAPKVNLYFLPETYRLTLKSDQEAFQRAIAKDQANHRNRPWVLKKAKVNNGQGIEMLAPNSPALHSAVNRSLENKSSNYVVQAYVCNELTWFGGEKFDMRFFWFVASVDPLIVLYQDGYVRVGGALYNETDFQSSGQHLTNHEFRTVLDDHVVAEDLWRLVRNHYEKDKARLSKLIVGDDPVQHVRNQLKEAISTMTEAFQTTLTLLNPNSKLTSTMENLFGFFGCDFIIDQDLDIFFIEAQVSPGMGQKQDFRIDVFRRLLRPVVTLVEEIYEKQVQDGTANLFPLENMGDYELVYVGNGGPNSQKWRYTYDGYQRSKQKKGCSLPPGSKGLPH